MKDFLEDLKYCFTISLKVSIIPYILGFIIGLIKYIFNKKLTFSYALKMIPIMGIWFFCFGLALAAMSFLKVDLMRPLTYEKKWKLYFKKLNLAQVIFFVCSFGMIYSVALEAICHNL